MSVGMLRAMRHVGKETTMRKGMVLVAVSDEYKNDKVIKDMLRAFKLKDIEQL